MARESAAPDGLAIADIERGGEDGAVLLDGGSCGLGVEPLGFGTAARKARPVLLHTPALQLLTSREFSLAPGASRDLAATCRDSRCWFIAGGGAMYGIMYGVRRTTIYLPDELKLALERTAAAQGKSEAEVVRHALVAATAVPSAPRLRVPLFDSGDPSLAERVDDELAAGFGD